MPVGCVVDDVWSDFRVDATRFFDCFESLICWRIVGSFALFSRALHLSRVSGLDID